MIQYREIFTIIDSAKGTLINQDGAKISRDDLLPRLILADEVILYASFVNVKEENSIISLEPKIFDNSLAFKIIGDSDNDNETAVMFSYSYLPEKSDFAKGLIAFRIKTNSARFADALKNVRSKKCDFVILGMGSDPISTVVLAKDQFIAENRPCENVVFEDVPSAEMMTREELQLLLNSKSPANHTHDAYALAKHTHNAADIIDLELAPGAVYTAGTGISIVDGVISCTVSPGEGDGENYSAGNGISISDDNKISIKGVSYFEEEQDGYIGLYMDKDGLHFATELIVTKAELSQQIGDINSILDEINGEEV
ncbi:MAG: hypothetical protein IKB71_04440 [Lentisphaeria bacterium]|nr:hypothetical protein [Lentisphaeria bacterium]